MRIFNRENGFQKGSWSLFPQDRELSSGLAEALNISPSIAQILINRGIGTVEAAKCFLSPEPSQLHSPFAMKDMEAATTIIWQAVKEGRRIAVYGDYDVDGIGATALLFMLLRRFGAQVDYHIPDRLNEGYGLNESVIKRMAEGGISLLITVDCGISDSREVALARELGMKVVITDHHLPPPGLPPADAIVNPRRFDCTYPFKELCGAGVAFKLGQALLQNFEDTAGTKNDPWGGMEEFLDLVALTTVADMVPLLGENRVLVTYGLRQMESSLRPGLSALCEAAAVGGKITTETIGFILAPRLNAAGRLGNASRALKLLLAHSAQTARPLANELQEENSRRQQVEANVLQEADKMVGEMTEDERGFFLLAAPGWPQGVIGIVASRLMEKYKNPVILISLADGQGKGSGRSGDDFNITAALRECSHLLLAFGGHHCAAGLTLQEENIPLLRRELNRLARQWRKEVAPAPSLYVDALLKPQQITEKLVRELESLEPFGLANPRPIFHSTKWLVEQKREVGRGQQHLQLGLFRKGLRFPAIFFNGKNRFPHLQPLRLLDLFFALSVNTWRGQDTLQLELVGGYYSDEHIQEKISLIDHRGLGRKLDYLQELGRQEGRSIVYVNTMGRLNRLKQQFGNNNKYSFAHQGQLPPGQGSMPFNLVLHDLPLQEEKLTGLLRNYHRENELKIHLLYGMEDWQDNMRLLTATVPSLSALEQIFCALEEMGGTGEGLDFIQTLARLKGSLSFSPTTNLLEKSLAIMEQAACLELRHGKIKIGSGHGGDYCKLLSGMNAVEQYSLARTRWQETLRWQKYLLEAAGEELLNFCYGEVQKG